MCCCSTTLEFVLPRSDRSYYIFSLIFYNRGHLEMTDRSSERAANGPVENQLDDPSVDAFQLMAQGLAQMQVANGRLHIALQQQEQRMMEALQQQEQRSQEAVREVLQLQEQGLQERINEVKQIMKGKIARMSEAVCNLTVAVNEGLKRVGARIETLESSALEREHSKDRKEHDAVEQLEGRMKNLETSVQRALKFVFPRVDALVSQLEHHELAVTPQHSDSVDSPTPTESSPGSGSSRPSSATCPSTSVPPCPVSSAPAQPSTSVTPSSPSASAQCDVGYEPRSIAIGRELCKAAEEGKVEEVQKLLANGARANYTDADGWTPLHWATRNANAEIVTLLLDEGADVHARDSDGDTPLHLAALYDRVGQCVFMLIDAGAHTDSIDKNGETPLGWASNAGNVAAVRLLQAGYSNEVCEDLEEQLVT